MSRLNVVRVIYACGLMGERLTRDSVIPRRCPVHGCLPMAVIASDENGQIAGYGCRDGQLPLKAEGLEPIPVPDGV